MDDKDYRINPISKILTSNHHGAEISVIWLVERSAIKLLILICYYGKTNEAQRNFNANTTFVALFEIRFRSLFFDGKEDHGVKLRQYLEIVYNRFVQERCF